MLKKIHVQDVKEGMYLQEICGSWMDHPFWKKSFLLNDPKDIKTLNECGVHEVWIDTDKGLDVDASVVVASKAEQQEKIEKSLRGAERFTPKAIAHISLQEEVERARQIHTRSKEAVTSMFQEVRMGKALQLTGVTDLVDDIGRSISRNPEAFLSLARLKTKD
ncbi:MAG TPA: DUF3391 domain-containing protein, partial [Gallionellaceae bacterium]|nr:DUF3391 domain-containing protein [Gallionellaceae bacterium]